MAHSWRKRSISIPLVINAGVSSLVLALGMTPTFAAFTASITGNANGAVTGTIIMQETNSSGAVTCLSTDGGGITLDAASCSTINKYGGEAGMLPGASVVVVSSMRNVGTVAASAFSLTPGPCTQSATGNAPGSATDFCSKIAVTIASGPNTIFTGSAAALAGAGTIDVLSHVGIPKVLVGAQIPLAVTTTLDATVDNSYQGLKVSQPLTWTFTA